MAKTSDRVSSIAAKYNFRNADELAHELSEGEIDLAEVAKDLKSLAASCLRQDEHKGFRGTITRWLERKAK